MATAETAGSHRRSRGAGGRPAPGPPERGLRGPHLPGSDTRRERLSLRIRRRDLGAGAGQGVEALVRVQESEGADLRRAVCVCVWGGYSSHFAASDAERWEDRRAEAPG